MRILIWSEGFWPQIGGAAIISVQHAKFLIAQGHDVLIITSRHDSALPEQEPFCGATIHRFPFSQTLLAHDLPRVRAIQQRVSALKRTFQPDVIHIHDCGPSVFFHLLTNTAWPAPLLLTIHSILPEADKGDGLLAQALRSADAISVVSQTMLDDICQLAPDVASRTSLIYDGLTPPDLSPAPLVPDAFQAPRLLCLGRVVEDKGFDLAIAAFAQVVVRYPAARLTIAGDGSERARLEEQAAALGLADAVEFTGWVLPENVPALINASTLVIMPSRWREPFGLVALEAALMERPIVATRVGGLAEVVVHGQTGLLVENEDVAGLAGAIGYLLDHPEFAIELGRAARRRAQEMFTWEQFVTAHERLYHQLVTAGRQNV